MTRQLPPSPDTGDAGDITDIQSHTYILSEWIFNKLATDPYFVNFLTKRTTQALPIEAWSQTPFLGVYVTDEPLAGYSYKVGDIELSHEVTIGFQIILANNDSVIMHRDLDRVKWFILRLLLRDDKLTNRFDTGLPGGVGINGIKRGRIRPPRWGLTGSKNETPIGEQTFELTFEFAAAWYPYGFPDLKRIDVITGFPGPGATPEQQHETPQVRMVYLFNPDAVPSPLPDDTEPPPTDPFPIPLP